MKSINDFDTEASAESLGLKHVSNGFVGWLVDGKGERYRPPRWLLDLLWVAEEKGRKKELGVIQQALGILPDSEAKHG